MRRLIGFVLFCILSAPSSHAQEPLRIVSWNMKATLLESLKEREEDFANLNEKLRPDVLILIEVAGVEEAKNIANAMGWTNYQGVVTSLNLAKDSVYAALEVAVLSKVQILSAVEFDAPEKDGVIPAFGDGALARMLPVVSEQALTNTLLPTLGAFGAGDRGTIRVEFGNGLTIFPVHLKSNSNSACGEIDKARSTIRTQDKDLAATLDLYFNEGFRKATEEHVENARKRERMAAAVLQEANKAVDEGQTVLIAGDFNTAFEENKFGVRLDADCRLRDYSCKEAPFPRAACAKGEDEDGFDDTLSILELGLAGNKPWTFLSRTLGRTYKNTAFSDLAIDHMAVRAEQASRFTVATKSDPDLFGSDHYAVFTEFRAR